MPRTFDRSWFVFESIENDQADRCVDLFERPDGSFGFAEFRRDVEDGGAWTPVNDYSSLTYPFRAAAIEAARSAILWFREQGG